MLVNLKLLAFALAPASAPSLPVQPPPLAIRVDRAVAADGTIGPGGWIVVRNGRIEALAAATAPPGAQTLEFADGVACPGLVDAVTALGVEEELSEPARAFTPEVLASDAFHADHVEFLNAARGGMTTVGLSPTSSNVVGGRVAIVRTHGDQGLAVLAVLGSSGPMRLALSRDAFQSDRTPTSRMGALPKLREMVKDGALAGATSMIVDAESPDEIRLALETVGGAGRTVTLLQPRQAEDALESVQGSQAVALLGPFSLDTPERDLELPKVLSGAGLAVGFTAGGDAAALRLTAALATRAGLDPKLALQAITSVPARALGVEADCGTLAAGKRADLVIFRGDPLDLGSRVELVLVGGAIVPPKEKRR